MLGGGLTSATNVALRTIYQINPDQHEDFQSKLPSMNYGRSTFTAKYYEQKIYAVGGNYEYGTYDTTIIEVLDLSDCGPNCDPKSLHWMNFHELEVKASQTPAVNFRNNLMFVTYGTTVQVVDMLNNLQHTWTSGVKTSTYLGGSYRVDDTIAYIGGRGRTASTLQENLQIMLPPEQGETINPSNVSSVAATYLSFSEFGTNQLFPLNNK